MDIEIVEQKRIQVKFPIKTMEQIRKVAFRECRTSKQQIQYYVIQALAADCKEHNEAEEPVK